VECHLLGPLEVVTAAGPLELRGHRRRSLLALLLVRAGTALTLDQIVDAVWGDEDTRGAANTVRTYISQLRKAMAGDELVISTVGAGYRLDLPRDRLDATRFEDLARRGAAASDPATRRELFEAALECWGGRALTEFRGLEWADVAARALETRQLEVLEHRIDADLALGRSTELLVELETLVREYPLSERMRGQHMLALYRSGRQGDALRACGELRSILADELGIEPSAEIAALELRMLDQDPSLLDRDLPGGTARVQSSSQNPELPVGTVTFLMTDIVSSTELWDQHPEHMAIAVRAHEAVIENAVVRCGGHMLKHRGEGDSTLSVFARAADALDAALLVRDEIAGAAPIGETSLALRVALHTGEAEQRDHDYFGPTLNRGTRIRSLAVGNEILCSRTTADLIVDALPSSISLVELGAMQLRGMRRSEVVYRVTAVADTRRFDDEHPPPHRDATAYHEEPLVDRMSARLAASAAGGPPLVGRDRERARLVESWRRARSGERQIVFISGEPGIGKTRLAAEVAITAHNDKGTILYGRSDESLGVPYQPFVEALRSFVESSSDSSLREALGHHPGELARLVPELRDRIVDLPSPLQSDPATEQYRLFDAVSSWLAAASLRSPIAVVLDDMHAATEPTLLLLRHVAFSERPSRTLLIVTFRESELRRGHQLRPILADLRTATGTRRVEHVELVGLDEEGVREFVQAAPDGEMGEAEGRFVHELQAHTGGNPFFVSEIIRNLVESGLIPEDPESRTYDVELLSVGIPAAARDVVLRRVERLAEEAQNVLTVAAVVGNEFGIATVAGAVELDEEVVLAAVEEAVSARLVAEVGPERFSFAHALVHAALYDELTESRQVRLHRRVGDAIQRLFPSTLEDHLSELAYHYARVDPDQAVRFAIAAADAALGSLAFADAINVCERAVAAIARARDHGQVVDEEAECDLLLRLGRAEFRAGRPSARDILLRAHALARRVGDPTRIADAVLAANRGFFARMGQTDRDLVHALETAIECQPAGDSAVLSELLASLASELEWADDGDRRFELSDRALRIARQAGDLRALTRVLVLRAITIAAPDTLEERIGNCNELLSLADQIADPGISFQAAWSRSPTAVESGDADAVDEMVARASRLAEELRQPTFQWQASFMRTSRSILRGDLDEAEKGALETLELGQPAHQSVESFLFYNEQMLEIRRWQDRLPEIIQPLGVFAGVDGADFGYSLVRYQYDAGEEARAMKCYESIRARLRLPLRRDLLAATSLCNLAYLAVRSGDVARAAQFYEALTPLASAFANTTVSKPVGDHVLGTLAATLHDFDRAEQHFERAVRAHEGARAPLLAAETRLEWARLRAERGDRSGARTLLDAARSTARERGAEFILRRCAEVDDGAG
jgi:DNA-binding SARP family transcriptional activator/tetratricopeptide (TPR) repeat protein